LRGPGKKTHRGRPPGHLFGRPSPHSPSSGPVVPSRRTVRLPAGRPTALVPCRESGHPPHGQLFGPHAVPGEGESGPKEAPGKIHPCGPGPPPRGPGWHAESIATRPKPSGKPWPHVRNGRTRPVAFLAPTAAGASFQGRPVFRGKGAGTDRSAAAGQSSGVTWIWRAAPGPARPGPPAFPQVDNAKPFVAPCQGPVRTWAGRTQFERQDVWRRGPPEDTTFRRYGRVSHS